MKSKSSKLLTAATVAALLCAGTVSRAQEEPQPPATRTEPAAAKTPATGLKSTTVPAPAIKPAASTAKAPAAPARPGVGAHTNVETTAGLEKRAAASNKPAAATGKPAAVTASPAQAPPK